MKVSINQPAYLPWLGYFDRIAKSDVHIVLDHVQFEKNSMINRNKIRTKSSWAWLTVPVKTKGLFKNLAINKVENMPSSCWAPKHFKALSLAYSRTSFFKHYQDYLGSLYQRDWPLLLPFVDELNSFLLSEFNISTPQIYSSSFDLASVKSDLVLELCLAVGGTTYISGPFGRDYLDIARFQSAGIDVEYHDYSHPKYDQVYSGFYPFMSSVDLLFNLGATQASSIFSCK